MKTFKNASKPILPLYLVAISTFVWSSACSRETRAPKVQVHVVDSTPANPPAPESPKLSDSEKPQASVARPVTWAIVNEKVIAPRCAACHSGTKPSAGLELTSAPKFKEAAPNIFAFVFYPPTPEAKMPLGGELTLEQKQVLGDYMVDGMLP